ncbi:MAG TPA: hypothetical protein VLU25_09685 [Acidobacteriota bacterium]|nr:hypothetical protein [Acidobacteriota bacterium]
MSQHIDFSQLEPHQRLDEAHLRDCAQCRADWEAYRLLRSQVEAAPRLDAPPFFAARVSHLAVSQGGASASYWWALQVAARRLLPLFASLVIAISAGLLWTESRSSGVLSDPAAQISAEEAQVMALVLEDATSDGSAAPVGDVFDLLASELEGPNHDQSK